MDVCHSMSESHSHQSTGLPNRLGHNGPYFGGAAPIAQDCARIPDHSDLFADLAIFEADLRTAADRVRTSAAEARKASLNLVETGVDDGGALDAATVALRQAARYLTDAQLLAEVLDERQEQRARAREARTFLQMIGTRPRAEMTATERLGEEARILWRINRLLERLAIVNDVDRNKAWPHVEADRMEQIAAELVAPSIDDIKAMDEEALLDALHRLEAEAADRRKRIALIHALRNAQHS